MRITRLAYLPIEDIIRKRQQDYYNVLAHCDNAGNSTRFIEFLLKALLDALGETTQNDPVSDPVSDPVKKLLTALANGPLSTAECMEKLGLSHRANFRKNYLKPTLTAGRIERTIPEKPNSRLQKYRVVS